MPHFYISFATATDFLGATVVQGINAADALIEASFRGLNPGGEADLAFTGRGHVRA